MKVEQVYKILNTITAEELGESVVVNEDLSNVVDIGKAFADAQGLDNYVRSLTDHIGRMVFVDRKYDGRMISVLRDGWEFGAIMQKVSAEWPDASENQEWELENGVSYPVDIFNGPTVQEKCYNGRTTYQVQMSFTRKQVMSAFDNATQLNAFFSMIYTQIANTMTLKNDALVARTVNAMISETLYSEYPGADYTSKTGVRAINLLKMYNDAMATELTAEKAVKDPAFIRFASSTIAKHVKRLSVPSVLYNVDGKKRFTPTNLQHLVLLDDFLQDAKTYLYSDTYHEEYVKLPNAESVPFWQAPGQSYAFSDISKIDVKNPWGHTVSAGGILGIIFDHDALGVTNESDSVESQYNPAARFYNNWYNRDAGYFADTSENFVVFFVA